MFSFLSMAFNALSRTLRFLYFSAPLVSWGCSPLASPTSSSRSTSASSWSAVFPSGSRPITCMVSWSAVFPSCTRPTTFTVSVVAKPLWLAFATSASLSGSAASSPPVGKVIYLELFRGFAHAKNLFKHTLTPI